MDTEPHRTTDEQLRRWVEAGKTAHPDSAWLPAMAGELLAARAEIEHLRAELAALKPSDPFQHQMS